MWDTESVRIPIACTLSAEDADERVNEWREFLSSSTTSVDWVNEHHLRLHLRNQTSVLEHAADLARREQVCCAFFDFSFETIADDHVMSVQVPADALSILQDFAALVARSS